MLENRRTRTEKDDWDEHWDRFSAAAEVGPTPRYRSRLIHSLLDFFPPGKGVRFLEIGSGTGDFAEEFCRCHPEAQYLGLELSSRGVATGRRRVPNARFFQRDLLDAASTGDFQDYDATHALCSEVIEHVERPSDLLRNAGAYCGPGCRLIVTVPGGPMNAFYEHIGHRRHYSPSQLSALLESAGLKVETAFGVGFPFFNLFRLLLSVRGSSVVSDASGPPSPAIKIVSRIFDVLFHFNSRNSGWQTFAIARYLG